MKSQSIYLVKLTLERELLKIRHMNYKEAKEHMCKEKVDALSVLKHAKEGYRNLKDNAKWPPANDAKDSKAINRNYGNVNSAATTELRNIVNSLVCSTTTDSKEGNQFKSSKFKQRGRKTELKHQFSSQRKPPRSKGRWNNSKKGNSALKVPPKSGESEIKFFDNKKRFWCSKCGRWTLSHGTNSHMTKEELDKSRKTANKANIARVDLDWHPAAFRAFVPPGIEQANRKPVTNSVGLVAIMFGLLTAIVLTIWWEVALCVLTTRRPPSAHTL